MTPQVHCCFAFEKDTVQNSIGFSAGDEKASY